MKKVIALLVLMLVLSLIAAQCGAAPTPQTIVETVIVEKEGETIIETVVVEKEVEVEKEVVVTATPEPAPEMETVELSIIHNWGPDDCKGPALRAIFEEFMVANPNIVIKERIVPDADLPTTVETAYLGNEEPDLVFHNYYADSLEWMPAGVTVPVGQYMDDWGLRDQFLDTALSQYTDDGEFAAFPLEGFNWPIWYNTAILEEVGVEIPQTMDELLVASEKIRAAGYQPFAVGGSDWTGARLSQMLLVSGLTPEEYEVLLVSGGFAENENALAAMETFVELRDNGVFADNAEGLEFNSMNELFFSGQAAMMHGGSWSYAEFPEELLDSVELGGLPLLENSPYPNPTAWAGFTAKGIHITRNGQEKIDAIEKLVKFMYQPENIARFVEDGAMIPPITGVEVDESKLNPLFVESLALPEKVTYVFLTELLIPGPVVEKWDRVANDSFIPNGMTAEEILQGIDAVYADYQP